MLRNASRVVVALVTMALSLAGIATTANAASRAEKCGFAHASGPLKNRFGKKLAEYSFSVHFCVDGVNVTSVGQPVMENNSVTTTGQVDQWSYDSEQHDVSYERTKRGQEGLVVERAKFVQFKSLAAPKIGVPLPVQKVAYIKVNVRFHANGTYDVTGSSG